MSNTTQKEQNVETVGDHGAPRRIRTPDLLIRREKVEFLKQKPCVTRSQNVRNGILRHTGQGNTLTRQPLNTEEEVKPALSVSPYTLGDCPPREAALRKEMI